MKEGLLWLDDDASATTEQKVARGVVAYRKKFGVMPDTCYVHSSVGELSVGPVHVKPMQGILLHHFWIGVEGENSEGQSSNQHR